MNGMYGMAGPVGSGVPNPYPLAVNEPLSRAYLRPLQEPLYDTNIFNFAAWPSALTYFQQPISTPVTGFAGVTKTEAETNLNQSSMLDYPREFSILGFNIVFDSTIGLQNLSTIIRRAFVQFVFSGRRPYLTCPLHRFPSGVAITGTVASTLVAGGGQNGLVGQFNVGLPHIANFYKFNLGRAALKIKPGEAFNFKLNWPQNTLTIAATLNNNIGVTPVDIAGWFICVSIVGLSWSPL